MGHGGQSALLCSPAQWRVKLACGKPSTAVGHSTQQGTGVGQVFNLHTIIKDSQTASPPLPIILCTPKSLHIHTAFSLKFKPVNPQQGGEWPRHRNH